MATDTRMRILREGARKVHKKGFNATGLQEVLAAAGIPKGSFYFYFKNKEDFGLQLIDYYARSYFEQIDRYLGGSTRSPLQRLRHFFDSQVSSFEKNAFKGG